MEELLHNHYVQVYYDTELNLVQYHWLPATCKMSSEEYQHEMHNILKCIEVHHPHNVIADWTNSEFVVVPELQTWLAQEIVPKAVVAGMRRAFFIVSDDFIQQLALEQLIEEDKTKTLNTFYQNSVEKVREWLKNNPLQTINASSSL